MNVLLILHLDGPHGRGVSVYLGHEREVVLLLLLLLLPIELGTCRIKAEGPEPTCIAPKRAQGV